ncbi:MAG: phage tail tape measure protein [Gloeomargaritales cyanobacterium]
MDLGTLVAHISVGDEYKKELTDAKKDFADVGSSVEQSISKVGPRLATAGKIAGGIGAAAIGGALSVGIASSLELDTANAKLRAQLGGSAEYSKEMGKIAGNLFAKAYGDSMEQVNDAVKTVVQSGALMEDATSEQIQGVTAKAMSLAQVFNVDVSESMRAVGQMVRTGMVKDADEGLNLIAVAFQHLGPQAQDILDTFNEYSTQFRKIGIDGKTALGMIQQMVKAGARDTDVAADALKEFAIRSVDGSKTTIAGFQAIGLNADEMAKKFAQGGQTAKDAFSETITALKNVKDPIVQNTAAVYLFGTQAGDLGAALYAIDPSKAVMGLGNFANAAADVDKVIGDTAQNKITAMQRNMDQLLAHMVNAPGILGSAGSAVAAFGAQGLSMAGSIAMVASVMPGSWATMVSTVVTSVSTMTVAVIRWVMTQSAQLAIAAGRMIATAAIYVAQWLAMAAAAVLDAAIIAGAWLVALGPIALVIAAIVGLAALVIFQWDNIKNATVAAWNAITGFVIQHKDLIVGILTDLGRIMLAVVTGGLSELVIAVIQRWDGIKQGFINGVNAVVGIVTGLPGRIIGALGDFGHMLWDAGARIIQSLIDGFMSKVHEVESAISNVTGMIRGALPFSPAKWGPLSGAGAPDIAGRKIGAMLADGINSSLTDVSNAASNLSLSARIQDMIAQISNTNQPVDLSGLGSILHDAVMQALDKAELTVSGSGIAKLTNTTNQLNSKRLGGF